MVFQVERLIYSINPRSFLHSSGSRTIGLHIDYVDTCSIVDDNYYKTVIVFVKCDEITYVWVSTSG